MDELNYHFLQYCNSSVTTAKKLKSVGIHGYKYFISIYLTDLICMKTYRIYKIFKCKVPTSYTDRWFLANITKAFLKERQFVKGEMGKEDTMNEDGPYCVHNWLSIPDNTPEKKKKKVDIVIYHAISLAHIGLYPFNLCKNKNGYMPIYCHSKFRIHNGVYFIAQTFDVYFLIEIFFLAKVISVPKQNAHVIFPWQKIFRHYRYIAPRG